MDYSERTTKWALDFFAFIEENHPDFEDDYRWRIIFSPATENPNLVYAACIPSFDLPKKRRLKLLEVFHEYYDRHRDI